MNFANSHPPHQKKSKFTLFKGVLFLIFILSIIEITTPFIQNTIYNSKPPGERLALLWKQDIEKQKNQTKDFWNQISKIEFFPGNGLAKKWVPSLKQINPILINSKGNLQLHIMVLGWKDKKNIGASLLYSIKEISSQNTIWETGRTYLLNDALMR